MGDKTGLALGRRGLLEAAVGAGLASQARGLAWAPPAIARQEKTSLRDGGPGVARQPRFGPVVAGRSKSPRFRTVLALDGGGTRGMVSTMVLKRLEEKIKDNLRRRGKASGDFEVDLADYFDLIAGTSIGSIIATYLTTRGGRSAGMLEEQEFVDWAGEVGQPLRPGTPGALEAIFKFKSDEIFPHSWSYGLPGPLDGVEAIFHAKFDPKGLNQVLEAALGDAMLQDCQTSLVVPTFELKTSRPVDFWASYKDGGVKETGYTSIRVRDKGGATEWEADREFMNGYDFKLRELAAASAAFPMMFPASEIQYPDGRKLKYADGGLIASNPTASALSYLRQQRNVEINDIAVLSLGCGVVLPDRLKVSDAGFYGWNKKGGLIPLLLDQKSEYVQSIVDGIYYKVLERPYGQYTRIQIALDKDDPYLGDKIDALETADDYEEMENLRKIGIRVAETNDEVIGQFVDKFLMV
ncbi:unnamed protein product [Ostreobium quekettii]|uniref:Patatin n=1 Tax=Ostreobium quekettii TaxID=121088 RepID=A0A8S1IZ90_9CHLO|nr:unnamed protein product [Ostreobium quekettii]|eukprot:evm.model.scf_513EXC.4 EVM.evm.TU.scf_513EXC.4   scf_513EXC:71742-74171(-)